MDDIDHLKNIYVLYVDRHGTRSSFVEREMGLELPVGISIDDRRNEPQSFRELFRNGYSAAMVNLYQKLMYGMRGKYFDQCDDELAGLKFVKAVIMKSLASYHADRSTPLAKFANEFDRLDVPEVRRKLYELAQQPDSAGPSN